MPGLFAIHSLSPIPATLFADLYRVNEQRGGGGVGIVFVGHDFKIYRADKLQLHVDDYWSPSLNFIAGHTAPNGSGIQPIERDNLLFAVDGDMKPSNILDSIVDAMALNSSISIPDAIAASMTYHGFAAACWLIDRKTYSAFIWRQNRPVYYGMTAGRMVYSSVKPGGSLSLPDGVVYRVYPDMSPVPVSTFHVSEAGGYG